MPFIIVLCFALFLYLIIVPAVASARANEALREVESLRREMRRLRQMLANSPESCPPEPALREEPRPLTLAPEEPLRAAKVTPPALPLIPPSLLPDKQVESEKPPPSPPAPAFSLEQFMGVKLFAWIGGLALFFGIVLFVKYAFEHDLVPPAVRVASGFITGCGLVVAGLCLLRREAYRVLCQTLCATGIVTLYGVSFAGHALYALYHQFAAFGLMSAITAAAFTLAVRLEARVVAVLGMLGGFLTPLLVSTGRDQPLALFAYITLLNAGILAVVHFRPWRYLTSLATTGTGLMITGWVLRFFTLSGYGEGTKTLIPAAVLVFFPLLFFAAACRQKRGALPCGETLASSSALAILGLTLCGAALQVSSIAERPWLAFGTVFALYLITGAAAWREARLLPVCTAAGGLVFLLLGNWSAQGLTPALLPWALVLFILFGLLQTGLPILWSRRSAGGMPLPPLSLWTPLLTLVLLLIGIVKLPSAHGPLWLAIAAVNAGIVSLASASKKTAPVLAAMGLTMVALLLWLLALLHDPVLRLASAGEFLTVLVFMSATLLAGGAWLARKLGAHTQEETDRLHLLNLAVLPAILPFPLLITAALSLPGISFHGLCGVALGLAAVLLFTSTRLKIWQLFPAALVALTAVQGVIHLEAADPFAFTGWHCAAWLLFLVWPFAAGKTCHPAKLPWIISACAAVPAFLLLYAILHARFPALPAGLIPALCALPPAAGLAGVLRSKQAAPEVRLSQLAWFGGVTLFLLTLIFPLQWEHHWLTLGWAMEGAALCWLYTRVPHSGLKLTGFGLLALAFLRLTLNQAILRSDGAAGWNWQLYTYGTAIAAHLAATRFLRPPRQLLREINLRSLLFAQAGILLFVLMNLEILAVFTPEGSPYISVQFGGHFARDMSLTIAWALYALGLIILGLWKNVRRARYTGICLMAVALLKLFLHDLSEIGSLYRITALIAVAIIALAASWVYQRYAARLSQPGPDTAKPGA